MSEWRDQDTSLLEKKWPFPFSTEQSGRRRKKRNRRSLANVFFGLFRFLDAYKELGIDFWGLTTGNEPIDGLFPDFPFNCMAFTPESQRGFVKLDLGPVLSAAGYGSDKLKLMIMDDSRMLLPIWANEVLKDANASKYISGIAFHWYQNGLAPASLLDFTHDFHPDMFLLASEACEGYEFYATDKVILGSWERAESYALDIIQDLSHWTTAWIDWNLALDLQGGPNWAKNFVDSPIIVNATSDEFYKQPMYYALGHFSKFLPPGSRRIAMSSSSWWFSDAASIAFLTPDDELVVIVLNKHNYPITVTIKDAVIGTISKKISARSIVTFRA